ncbi:hypothetical protein GNI_155650 [Gregarina niphandrodes]|uniref:Transmembrane protein n=1 Tax=Gregarina niphandrodes TaxID=110365 RepID=A0A023B031_GRENI|nr:hypothetical protein GNI_155650 [Gregarina niphandrodes]EZG43923.1 hypothetical protein GNI_155650 [Gregarina niphandrodes]|eukprot:XP_011132894.1 hypothetical protein GNI_155650 [Gregarina niphandrodes]
MDECDDPRLECVCLLTLLLSFPFSEPAGTPQDVFQVYTETLERRVTDDLTTIYCNYNDLTECISRLTVKYQAVQFGPGGRVVLSSDYRKGLYSLLQVTVALMGRLAFSLFPSDAALDDAFNRIKNYWPPSTPHDHGVNLEKCRHVWVTNVSEPYTRNLKLRKLNEEMKGFVKLSWTIAHDLYAQDRRGNAGDATIDGTGIPAAIHWDCEPTDGPEALTTEQAVKIKEDIIKLSQMQEQISAYVHQSSGVLDRIECGAGTALGQTEQSVAALATASAGKSFKWPFTGAAVGAAVGSVLGIVGGPAGIMLGASAGGALGGSAGKALKDRHREMISGIQSTVAIGSTLRDDVPTEGVPMAGAPMGSASPGGVAVQVGSVQDMPFGSIRDVTVGGRPVRDLEQGGAPSPRKPDAQCSPVVCGGADGSPAWGLSGIGGSPCFEHSPIQRRPPRGAESPMRGAGLAELRIGGLSPAREPEKKTYRNVLFSCGSIPVQSLTHARNLPR